MRRIAYLTGVFVNIVVGAPYLVTLEGEVEYTINSGLTVGSSLKYQLIMDTERKAEYTDGSNTYLLPERTATDGYFYWDLVSDRYLDVPPTEWISNAGYLWSPTIPLNFYNPALPEDPITSVLSSFWLGRDNGLAYGYFSAFIRFDQRNAFMWDNWDESLNRPANPVSDLPIPLAGPESWIPGKVFFSVVELDCLQWASFCGDVNSSIHGKLVVKSVEAIPEADSTLLIILGLISLSVSSVACRLNRISLWTRFRRFKPKGAQRICRTCFRVTGVLLM